MTYDTQTGDMKILVVAGGETRERLVKVLAGCNYAVATTDIIDRSAGAGDAIMLDVSGRDADRELPTLRRAFPQAAILLVGTPADLARWADEAPDCEWLAEPFSDQMLITTVSRIAARRRMESELASLRAQVAMSFGFDNVIGISRSVDQIRDSIRRIAPTDLNVMISGAPGTGKELIARTLHYHSIRRHEPFVAVDCRALPSSLLAAELFGSANLFPAPSIVRAQDGTLFLDGIAELSGDIQSRLLAWLRDPNGANVRVISATSKDIRMRVAEGEFAEELLAALNAVTLRLPPLVDRLEDIELLADYFLRRFAAETGSSRLSITRRAADKLRSHTWPGNIRELENTLRRAAVLCQTGEIGAEDISFVPTEPTPFATHYATLTMKGSLMDTEQRSLILRTLSQNEWNFTRTAEELGIGRTTLWRKIKKYNLARTPDTVDSIG